MARSHWCVHRCSTMRTLCTPRLRARCCSTHDWVTLHVNGIRYLGKAPLLYWSVAASFKIFREHDWAARLPLALYALALFSHPRARAQALCSPQAGFYAALCLLTASGIFGFTRILLPDVILCLWISLAMYFFWKSLDEITPRLMTALGFDICCALGVLTKGLVGAVIPLAIILVYLFVTRNLRHLLRWHPIAGPTGFLIVAAPWHILAALRNPPLGVRAAESRVRATCTDFCGSISSVNSSRAISRGARRIISIPCRCRSSGCCCLPLSLRGASLR